MNNETNPIPAPVRRLVGQLRELLEKATPGPWAIANWGYSDEPHMVIEGPEIPKPATRDGFWFGGQKAVDWGDDWNADNASLIVAAVNSLPALLAIAEAAAVVSDDQGHMENCAAICGPPGEQWLEESRCNCAMPRLRTALSLLPNPEVCGPAPVSPPAEKPDAAGSVSTALMGGSDGVA